LGKFRNLPGQDEKKTRCNWVVSLGTSSQSPVFFLNGEAKTSRKSVEFHGRAIILLAGSSHLGKWYGYNQLMNLGTLWYTNIAIEKGHL